MMIVACPACSVRFKMDPALIPEKGRIVRCSGCSHKWRLMPSDFKENPPSKSVTPQKKPTSPVADFKKSAPPSSTKSVPRKAPSAEVSVPARKREAPPSPNNPKSAPPARSKKPYPPKPLVKPKKNIETEEDDDDDFEDDIEAIKQKQKFTTSTLLLISFGVTILILFFVMRSYIIQAIPQTEKIYSIFGYESEVTGITIFKPFLEKTAPGKLAVQGTVMNADTQKTLPIPPLKISLMDRSNFVIQEFIYTDFKNKFLAPGAEEDFIYVLNLPENAIDVRLEFVGQ